MIKEEFIGKLQMCYFGDRNAFNEIVGEYDRLKAKYERIYNENCKLREQHNINDISLLDENNRLNNIINELEKYLKENIKLTKTAVHFEILDDYDTRKYKRDIALFEMVLDKLKELKDSD